MSETYFRQQSLLLAKQLYPNYEGDVLIDEAERIFKYIRANEYKNFIGMSLLSEHPVGFAEMLFLQDDTRLVPLKLRDFQREALERWTSGTDEVVVHSRSIGMTTLLCVYALWLACFRDQVNLGFIVTNRNSMRDLVRLMVSLHSTAAIELPQIDNYTVSSIQFRNGNRIKMITPTTTVLGLSLSHVLSDNSAAIPLADDENFYSLLMFMNRGQTIVAGTPGPNFGIFYELATNNNLMSMNRVDLPWTVNPSYDKTWEQVTKAALSPKVFANHYECQFLKVKD